MSAEDRARRLAAELRANLARRKAQARSRRAGGADGRPEGLVMPAGEGTVETGPHSADSSGAESSDDREEQGPGKGLAR